MEASGIGADTGQLLVIKPYRNMRLLFGPTAEVADRPRRPAIRNAIMGRCAPAISKLPSFAPALSAFDRRHWGTF